MSAFFKYINDVTWGASLEQRIDVFTDVSCIKTACFEGKFGKHIKIKGPKQVHGKDWVQQENCVPDFRADAVYGQNTELIGVFTADCLPLLYVNPEKNVAGAVHMGWRGLCAGILESAPVDAKFVDKTTLVALGPCIRPESFEVGPEVLAQFTAKFQVEMQEAFWLAVSKGKNDRWHIDLQMFAVYELFKLGIKAENIEVHQVDTVSQNHNWFSYRCESPTGRNIACLQLRK